VVLKTCFLVLGTHHVYKRLSTGRNITIILTYFHTYYLFGGDHNPIESTKLFLARKHWSEKNIIPNQRSNIIPYLFDIRSVECMMRSEVRGTHKSSEFCFLLFSTISTPTLLHHFCSHLVRPFAQKPWDRKHVFSYAQVFHVSLSLQAPVAPQDRKHIFSHAQVLHDSHPKFANWKLNKMWSVK
jgi:hypothetical protein